MQERKLRSPKGEGSIPRSALKEAVKKVVRSTGNPPPLQKMPFIRKKPLKK